MEFIHLSEEIFLTVSLDPSFNILDEDSLGDLAMNGGCFRDRNDLLGRASGSGLIGGLGSSLLVLFDHLQLSFLYKFKD